MCKIVVDGKLGQEQADSKTKQKVSQPTRLILQAEKLKKKERKVKKMQVLLELLKNMNVASRKYRRAVLCLIVHFNFTHCIFLCNR